MIQFTMKTVDIIAGDVNQILLQPNGADKNQVGE